MIVQRNTYEAKSGRVGDLVAFVKGLDERARSAGFRSYRVFTSRWGGAGNRVIVEFDWESQAEMEKVWERWNATAGADGTFGEQWWQVCDHLSDSELLDPE